MGVKKPWKGYSMAEMKAEMKIDKNYNNRLPYKGWKEKQEYGKRRAAEGVFVRV